MYSSQPMAVDDVFARAIVMGWKELGVMVFVVVFLAGLAVRWS